MNRINFCSTGFQKKIFPRLSARVLVGKCVAMRFQVTLHLVATGRIHGICHNFITTCQLLLDLGLQLAPQFFFVHRDHPTLEQNGSLDGSISNDYRPVASDGDARRQADCSKDNRARPLAGGKPGRFCHMLISCRLGPSKNCGDAP